MIPFTPNMAGLVKAAGSVYDMYDHENYAERWNEQNPVVKNPLYAYVERTKDDGIGVDVPKAVSHGFPMPKHRPVNQNAPEWPKEVTHVYPSFASIEGTGHGPAYGRPNRNNPYYG